MDLSLPDPLRALRDEALALGRRAAAEGGLGTEDTWLAVPDRAFSRELGRRGWLGMTWPTEAGGGGRSPLERFVVYEALLEAGAPLAATWFADRQIGPTLLAFGSPDQRDRHLPGILDGTARWSIGLSEPDTGSDVAGIRTVARAEGDSFVVTGQKVWTSGAGDADWLYLIARTDPDAPPHRGLSELIVDLHAPRVGVTPIRDLVGDHHFCEVHLDEVVVPKANLVGSLHGSFRQVMRQLEHERGGIDRLLSNRRLYLDVLPLADATHPVLRQEIAAIESGYRIGRLLVLREVLGSAPPGFSAATKTLCTELEQRIARFCGQVLGAHAQAGPDPLGQRVARNLAYATGYTIMGGTSEILRTVIAERLLGLPRVTPSPSTPTGVRQRTYE